MTQLKPGEAGLRTRFLLLLLAAALGGCQKPPPPQKAAPRVPANAVVSVNGDFIAEDEVSYFFRGAHGQRISDSMKLDALNELIDQELLYQKGLSLGLDDDSYHRRIRGLQLQLRTLERKEMVARVYNEVIAPNINVTEEEANAFFKAHHDRFTHDLELRVFRFADDASAHKALADLRAGRKPDVPGYQPGWMSWEKIPFEWHDVVYNLKPGETSDVFKRDRKGIRIFQLIARRETGPVRYKDIHNSIINRLRQAKTEDAFDAYVKKLESEAKIVHYMAPGEPQPSGSVSQ